MNDQEWVVVCSRCGYAHIAGAFRTVSRACVLCHGYDCTTVREALVVPGVVPPAERYVWTPYLERRSELS